MKRLILITDVFPWGRGEKSFIMPEVEYLKKKYKLTILSRAPLQLLEDKENVTILDDDIELLHYPEPELSKVEKWGYISSALGNKEFRSEMKEIWKSKLGLRCLKETYFFYIRAVRFLKWMKKRDLFADLENTIFYSYWANYSVYTLAIEKNRNRTLKYVSRIHRYDLYNEHFKGGRQPFKKYVDKWIDKMVFIAQEGFEYYLEHFSNDRCDTNKYAICRLGVEKQTEVPEKVMDGVFRMVSCSIVNERKRVELIIQALAEVEERVEWHHFGDGVMLKETKDLADKLLKGKSNIQYLFHGYTPNMKVIDFYRNNWVDCFITTSASEGCPVSIQEAMSFGMPIIGTDVGEIQYMIEGNGVLLSTDPTVWEIANAIQKLCALSEQEKCIMRKKSLALWERDYRIENNAGMFIDLLEAL